MADVSVIGVIGLGHMGGPIAGRLAAAGYGVQAYDLSTIALAQAGERGARPVRSAAEAARGASHIILMLPDSDAVETVTSDSAFLSALQPGALLVDMGSSEPSRTRSLAASLAEHGVRMVDAPVSGGVAKAVSGELAIMVGGADQDVEHVRPVLAHLGRVFRAGPIGAGHAVKALNNLMSAAHLLVTSEAIVAGQRFGLDPATMLEIFNASSGRSGSTENKWPKFVLPNTYNSGFSLRLMLKDMRIATLLAEQMGTPSRLGEGAARIWAEASEDLPPTADHTEIARWLLARAGTIGEAQ